MPYTLKGSLLVTSQLDIKGSTSGTITFNVPAIAGTQSYTWPTAYPGTTGFVLISNASGTMSWAAKGTGGGGGTVTNVSIVSANGFAGTVATSTTTPAITLSTTIGTSGTPLVLIGNGTSISGITLTTAVTNTSSISGTSLVFRDTQSTPNTITISAPSAFTASSALTFAAATIPTRYLGADAGSMYWNYPISTNYTSPSTIAVGDMFAGIPASSNVTFGQYFVADDSEMNLNTIDFNLKAWPNGTANQIFPSAIAWSGTTTVNGNPPTNQFVMIGSTAFATTPTSRGVIFTSVDGTSWVERSNTAFAVTTGVSGIIRAVFGTSPSQTEMWFAWYLGTYYRSLDSGVTWASITAPPFGSTIRNMYFVPGTTNVLFATTTGNTATTSIYYTTDGSTWTAATLTGNTLTGPDVIIAGPGTYPNQQLVTFQLSGISMIQWVSNNSGVTWTAGGSAYGSASALPVTGNYDSTTSTYFVTARQSGSITTYSSPAVFGSNPTTPWTQANEFPVFYTGYAQAQVGIPLTFGGRMVTVANPSNGVDANSMTFLAISQTTSGTTRVSSKLISNIPATSGIFSLAANDQLIMLPQPYGNYIGILKRCIYIEDGINFIKAPLGTYKCLGKAGTATNSFLWQRVA